jgi:hypothetical protein
LNVSLAASQYNGQQQLQQQELSVPTTYHEMNDQVKIATDICTMITRMKMEFFFPYPT